jgi:hypothetical protein
MEDNNTLTVEEGQAEAGEIKVFNVTAENGKKFVMRRQDPYGFWTVRAQAGRNPDVLAGQYTTTSAALSGIKHYMSTKEA